MWTMNHKRLHDIMPALGENGIFNALEALDVPWADDIDDEILDLEYMGNTSGDKYAAPLPLKLAEANDDGKLTTTQIGALAAIITAKYLPNWTKLYATLSAEYDPLKNYEMTEEGMDTITDTGTITDEGSDDLTHGHVETASGSDTVTTNVYGFNSSTASPDSQVTSQPGNVMTHSGTDARSLGNERTLDTEKEITHGLSRSGNIGVTTSQQMLQAERDVWMWDFFKIVFADVDKVLTLPIY